MVTTQSGLITSKQQELSVIFSNISSSTSRQGQPQEMMAAGDGIQDPFLDILNISTLEHLKLYNKAVVGLPENYSYDLNRFKWTGFYQ